MDNANKEQNYPDFVDMLNKYRNQLSDGQRAEIRRCVHPDELKKVPALYRVVDPGFLAQSSQQRRVVFCLSTLQHQDDGPTLGQALGKAGVSERRLMMVMRSENPNDLLQLKRVLMMCKITVVDINKAGKTLFFWGDKAKSQLIEDYFFNQHSGTTN